MKIELVGMKSARIPDLGKSVVRGENFEAPDEIAERLIATGMFKKVYNKKEAE
jgi:hypothetical protein